MKRYAHIGRIGRVDAIVYAISDDFAKLQRAARVQGGEVASLYSGCPRPRDPRPGETITLCTDHLDRVVWAMRPSRPWGDGGYDNTRY